MAGIEARGGATQPFAGEAGAADARGLPGSSPGRWRLLDRLVVAAFAAALVLPMALLLAGRKPADIENRAPRRLPALTIAGLADATWPAGVDGFLTDHLWPRPYAIRLRAQVYWLSGGTGNPNVIRGVDDWLFVRDELGPDCHRTAAQQAAGLEGAAAAFAARGMELRIVIPPDKHTIYPDKLPPNNPFPPSCVELNREVLDAAIARVAGIAIDLTGPLQAARAVPGAAGVYYEQDTHWTPTGALVGIEALARSFGPGVWSAGDVQIGGRHRRLLDTPRLLGLRRVVATPRVVIRPDVEQHLTDVPVPVEVKNARAVFRITSTGRDDLLPGRTLIVYDSFFGIDKELVAPYFADSVWVHFADMEAHPELGRLLGPFDRVIVERVARGFYSMNLDEMLAPVLQAGAPAAP